MKRKAGTPKLHLLFTNDCTTFLRGDLGLVREFPVAAVTNSRNVFSYSSVGQMSEIKVLTGLISSGVSEGESVPCFSPRFGRL